MSLNTAELATEVVYVLSKIEEAEAAVKRHKRAMDTAPFLSDEEAEAQGRMEEAESELQDWKADLARTLSESQETE